MIAATPELLLYVRLAYLAVYAAIFVIDLRTRLIPNVITYPSVAAALFLRPDGIGPIPVGHLAAGLVAAALFFLMSLRGWMGMGDAKLVLLIGMLSGPLLTPIALWVGFVFGGVIAIALVLLRKKSRRDTIPFGPYLALGGAAVLLFGRELLAASGLAYLLGP